MLFITHFIFQQISKRYIKTVMEIKRVKDGQQITFISIIRLLLIKYYVKTQN